MEIDSEARLTLKRRFVEFLEQDIHGKPYYRDELLALKAQPMNEKGGKDETITKLRTRRLTVKEHHLRQFDESLLLRLLQEPTECLPAFEDALKEFARAQDDEELQKILQTDDELHVGLEGDFGRHEVSPRDLSSALLNKMVCAFGIVTRVSLVRPKVVRSVHYCDVTKAYTSREYRDVTSLNGLPTGAAYPQKDDQGNPLITEFGLCRYRDNQVVTIQELPETAPAGHLPHSTELILEDDLVDMCKPGDRVAVVGIYKAIPPRGSGATSGVFKSALVAISVHKLTKEAQIQLTNEEAMQVRAIGRRADSLDLLANSLAPSIFGHSLIKKGLVLQLVGGQEKNLANGTHLRGDINCLMVGDPGVAKSQLLRAVMNIAPHSVSTTGRGSSGVGLTAAVTVDQETGEKRLEAGAMVLADRGVVCIDEFDKMSDMDRVAIHEVMEQQTVTIAKAGIHTSLNARCSVLAAANPLYGSYDKSISVTRNVNLPDSLLSRFDMLFVVLDQMDASKDRQVALHVVRQHRYRPPGEDGRGAQMQETIHDRRLSIDPDEAPSIWLKTDARLTGRRTGGGPEALTTDFLRKFIVSVRRYYKVKTVGISNEAADMIREYYTELRAVSGNSALPVTARSLETIIRIATASAKLHFRLEVNEEDVGVAMRILNHVLKTEGEEEDEVKEVNERQPPKPKSPAAKRARRAAPAQPSDDEDEGGDNDDNAPKPAAKSTAGPSMSAGARRSSRAVARSEADAVLTQHAQRAGAAQGVEDGQAVQLSESHKRTVIDGLKRIFREYGHDFIPVDNLIASIREKDGVVLPIVAVRAYVQALAEDANECSKLMLPCIVYSESDDQFFWA